MGTLLNVVLFGILTVLILDREEGCARRAAGTRPSQPERLVHRHAAPRREARLRARLHAARTPLWARDLAADRRRAAGPDAAGLTLLERDRA